MVNHPDFSLDAQDLKLVETYIQFFLDTVATMDNISYIYCVSGQLKTVKDKLLPDSTNLYVFSELIQIMIRELCASNSWTLQTYPEKIGMPRELFERLSSSDAATVMKTIYLETESNFLKTRRTPVRKSQIQHFKSPTDGAISDEENINSAKSTPVKRKNRDPAKVLKKPAEDVQVRKSSRPRKVLKEISAEGSDSV
jgi:sister-chromatid-cohesion protein PDS5